MNSFGILLGVTVVIVGLSLLLLGVQTFFSKKKKFPHMHVGGNMALAKKGVYCVQTQDAMERREALPLKRDMEDDGTFQGKCEK
ncbi:MAG: hypothetical protein K6F48_01455 [Paludibacteraceae bacterium]|nr:hypothetical protein [Paludibacteraceae bacterium]